MKNIKIGLTGLGRIGKMHLSSLVYHIPEAEVVAVSDISLETRAVTAQFGISNHYHSFEEVLNHQELDAVIICTPTPTHQSYIEMAAEAGKHIFCEKPLDLNLTKIEAIAKTVQDHGVKLQVGFNRRFDPDFAKVKKMVEDDQIGEPHILRITSRDPAPPPMDYLKASGGLFMDMTIHDFDMARFISGSEVTEVYAQGMVRVDEAIGQVGDIDTAIIQLRFENDLIAAIDNSRQAVYGYDQRLEIFGSKGMSRISNHFSDKQQLYTEKGLEKPPLLHFFMERYKESYVEEMKSFLTAVAGDKEVAVGHYDALMATKIALAANKSILENRPVRLEEII